uniref:Uncharacterized protein n=1 Tax=Oryza glaberrima TaxID=4538 RepID=I1QQK7_ORYGL
MASMRLARWVAGPCTPTYFLSTNHYGSDIPTANPSTVLLQPRGSAYTLTVHRYYWSAISHSPLYPPLPPPNPEILILRFFIGIAICHSNEIWGRNLTDFEPLDPCQDLCIGFSPPTPVGSPSSPAPATPKTPAG